MRHTRRIPLFASLVPLLFGNIQAERKPVAFGMVGGITGASFWGDEVKEVDTDIWPTVGFTMAFHLPVFLGAEIDMIYASKGGAIRRQESDRTLVNTIKLHALEFPLLVKLTAPTGTEVTPFFFGGPSLSYYISKNSFSEYIDIAPGGIVSPEEKEPLISKDDLADYEFTLCLGGGVEWGLGSFQVRFDFGRDSLDKTGAKDVKTFLVAVMAGFIF